MANIPTTKNYQMPTAKQLPDNLATWQIDPARAVVLIHDMQKYFINHINDEQLKSTLINNIYLIHQRCKQQNIPIAYTAQKGNMTKHERGLLNVFWGPGMQASPSDRAVIDKIKPDDSDWLFSKWRYSAFHKSDLLKNLREHNRDQLIICGVYAHVGVLITAVEAFSNDIETFLVADAIADFSLEHHLWTLNYAAKCCAKNVLTEEVLT